MQLKKAYKLIAAGVVVRDPQRLDIRGTLVCGKGVEIDINVVFEGDVMLEDGVIIGANCILRNCKIGKDTQINPFSLVEEAIIGEKSFVGPRPLVKNQYDMIPENFQQKIKLLKPGITGIGSIVFRDEERFLEDNNENSNEFYKTEIVPFKATLECWYEENASFIIDILLILTTIIMVVFPRINLHKYFFGDLPQHPLFNPA